MKTCLTCSAQSWGQRCKACASKAQLIRSEDDAHTQRLRREKAAPGLTSGQRSKLLARWKQQGKRCTYCLALADTVDHVLPLVRGGTNHEGNLTPCCRRCNSSKAGYMVAEWKHSIHLPPRTEPLPWRATPKRKARARPRFGKQLELITRADLGNPRAKPKTPRACGKCGAVFLSHTATYCSKRCQPSTISGAQQRRRRRERSDMGGHQSIVA